MTDARIVARTPAVLSHRFSTAGAADVSVTVTDAADITLVDAAAATPPQGDDAPWTYQLDPAVIPEPTLLKVAWDADGGWVETRHVEVAGGRYCTVAKVKAGAGDGRSINRVDDNVIAAAIAVVEDRIDQATLTAWVPRFKRLRLTGTGGPVQTVPNLRRIVAASIDGRPVDPSYWTWSPSGLLVGIPALAVADVDVIHGWGYPPPALVDAIVRAVREVAAGTVGSRIPATAESMTGGGMVFNFAHQADLARNRPFGIPDVDAVVMAHRAPVPVLA